MLNGFCREFEPRRLEPKGLRRVGMVDTQADEADEATEDEAMNVEPSCAFAKGYGRFGIGYTRLATALGNFRARGHRSRKRSGSSIADLRAKNCHVPHRVESDVYPF